MRSEEEEEMRRRRREKGKKEYGNLLRICCVRNNTHTLSFFHILSEIVCVDCGIPPPSPPALLSHFDVVFVVPQEGLLGRGIALLFVSQGERRVEERTKAYAKTVMWSHCCAVSLVVESHTYYVLHTCTTLVDIQRKNTHGRELGVMKQRTDNCVHTNVY